MTKESQKLDVITIEVLKNALISAADENFFNLGYVSVINARRDYGVAINERDGEYLLDEVETAKLRTRRH